MSVALRPPESRRPRFVWYVAAAMLLLSGLVHVGVWLATGGEDLAGPVSWRKPILFGFSAGATAASFGWIVGRLRRWRWEAGLASVSATALVVEVALITLQTWRGVPSHFNHGTSFDHAIHVVMDVLITVVTLYALMLTVRAFRSFEARPETTLAVRAGLGLLVVSCAIGYAILAVGTVRMGAGLDPSRYGPAGVPKFPHGVAIHALQLLPLLAAGLQQVGLGSAMITRRIAAATASQSFLLAFAIVQTVAGRARFDTSPATVTLLVASVLLGLYAVLAVVMFGRTPASESSYR